MLFQGPVYIGKIAGRRPEHQVPSRLCLDKFPGQFDDAIAPSGLEEPRSGRWGGLWPGKNVASVDAYWLTLPSGRSCHPWERCRSPEWRRELLSSRPNK